MDWAQVYDANRPYRRRVLAWRILGAVSLFIGLAVLVVIIARGAGLWQWRSLVGLLMGLSVCASAVWMYWRAHRIGTSSLGVVRGSITAMTPGDYDLPSSVMMTVSSAFSFESDGTTTPTPTRLGQQHLSMPDYNVFKALSEGNVNVTDVQFLCLPDGSVISLLEDALRRI